MELRRHPLIFHRGVSSWPPIWKWQQGPETKYLSRIEFGVLKNVRRSGVLVIEYILFLTIEHEGNEYLGTLVLHDAEFHRQIHALLLEHLGEPIEEIGSLDVSHHPKPPLADAARTRDGYPMSKK